MCFDAKRQACRLPFSTFETAQVKLSYLQFGTYCCRLRIETFWHYLYDERFEVLLDQKSLKYILTL